VNSKEMDDHFKKKIIHFKYFHLSKADSVICSSLDTTHTDPCEEKKKAIPVTELEGP
jgi:hypothetical protein